MVREQEGEMTREPCRAKFNKRVDPRRVGRLSLRPQIRRNAASAFPHCMPACCASSR